MSAPFRFKQFVVRQENAPMKVGTDGVLLGAWARGGERILDVGTGTGLIALMMAQRYGDATITAIDINEDAIRDAVGNVAESPFAGRIEVKRCALQEFGGRGYDAVVCNPPYFVRSLRCPDGGRTEARHAESLNTRELAERAWEMLREGGRLSVILPAEQEEAFVGEGREAGFVVSRIMRVRPTEGAAWKRVMVEMTKGGTSEEREEGEMYVEKERHVYSDEYREMTKEFYLEK